MAILSRKEFHIFAFLFLSLTPFSATADIHSWSLGAEVASVGSLSDRVLWNLRPGLNLKWDSSLAKSSALNVSFEARVRADTQAEFAASRSRYDGRLDTAIVGWTGSSANVALGWQKFTWGDSAFLDGVDVLNPRDLSEPLYTDDELLKIATPAVSAQYLGANTIFQTVLILKPERSPVPDEIESLRVAKPKRFEFGDQLELGVKAGGLLKSGWDINGYIASHLERVPQIVLLPQPPIPSLRVHEPRVATLGLTATQSSGDWVFRSEVAMHSNRAVPKRGITQDLTADQFVVHLTSDLTVGSDLILTGEIWAEKWTEPSTADFSNANILLGFRIQKPFLAPQFDSNLALLISPRGEESFVTTGLSWKFLESWEWDLDAYFVQLSKGHSLERRNLKDLLRSSLRYQF